MNDQAELPGSTTSLNEMTPKSSRIPTTPVTMYDQAELLGSTHNGISPTSNKVEIPDSRVLGEVTPLRRFMLNQSGYEFEPFY